MAHTTNNPLTILKILDSHLTAASTLILIGRSALALGYKNPPQEWQHTEDVDGVLPAEYDPLSDIHLWEAKDRTNEELQSSGLYIEHIFSEEQILLSKTWKTDVEKIELPFKNLSISKLCSEDCILSKMMRTDKQDRADILFLLQHTTPEKLQKKLEDAVCPVEPEIEEIFEKNKKWLATLEKEYPGGIPKNLDKIQTALQLGKKNQVDEGILHYTIHLEKWITATGTLTKTGEKRFPNLTNHQIS
jgi:hypothetical protein